MTPWRHPSTLLSDGDLAQLEAELAYPSPVTNWQWFTKRLIEELRYYKARNAILELRNE